MSEYLKDRTREYVHYFNTKDIKGVLSLVHDDFKLKDPGNLIEGKEGFRAFLEGFFTNEIGFKAKDVFTDAGHSVIHFDLKVNEDHLKGVDIIKWEDGKMISLVAYL